MPTDSRFREVLICVAGGSPAIITETIYALAKQEPSIRVDEIYIITTAFGKKMIEDAKLNGVIAELCQECNIPSLELTDESFVMLKNENGKVLDDIRTVAENELAGIQIATFIRQKTADSTTRIHASIAGGRKTMTFFLGSTMSIFGREQDRLYHVLVSPLEFEGNPKFFYPKDDVIACRMPDGSTENKNALNTHVDLADLNFIKLNTTGAGKSFRKLIEDQLPFSKLIEDQQYKLDILTVPNLRVALKARTAFIGGKLIKISPKLLMLYAYFLELKLKNCQNETQEYCRNCTSCYINIEDLTKLEVMEDLANIFTAINNGQTDYGTELKEEHPYGYKVTKRNKTGKVEHSNQVAADIRVQFTRINSALNEQLLNSLNAEHYEIEMISKEQVSFYGIKLDKSKISIQD